MRRETAAAAAFVFVCLASCGFPVPSTEGDGGPGDDVLPPAVTVGFAEATSLQDESSGTVMIPVSLSGPASDTVTVAFAITGGSALRPDDFDVTSPAQTLTFSPGEVMQHIELAIVDDMIAEPDETIELALSSPTGATLGTSAHTLTISANTLPRVSARMSRAQDNENKTANVVFELDTASSTEVSVGFTLGGTATDADHGLVAGTVTFPAGSTEEVRAIGVVNDALDEDDETIEVTLNNPVGAIIATTAPATYTIVDDDPEPVATFNTNSMTRAESATSVMFEVRLSAVSGRAVTVPFSVDAAGSTATDTADYTISTPSPLTFPAGTQVQQITITIVQDSVAEYSETVKLDLGTPTNATLGNTASRTRTLTISNDDPWCGGAGPLQVCYPQLPASARTLPSSIDTDSYAGCQGDQPTGWTGQGQAEACVVLATDITINATTVTGSRPLVLFASEDIMVTGVLDASSAISGRVGPASPSSGCGMPIQAPGLGGGGAGGSFMTIGGDGGTGNAGAMFGRAANPLGTPPTVLRGGCDGQPGGGTPGPSGRGGGAVYLIASGSISITGAINASGSAGEGGEVRSGGSGGGSGGMIVLHAPTIAATGATLMANGGGGAGGGNNNSDGVDGFDPALATPTISALGGPGPAGTGGRGFATGSPATDGDGTGFNNDGGGGGGGGGGYIQASAPLTGAQVSAGRVVTP